MLRTLRLISFILILATNLASAQESLLNKEITLDKTEGTVEEILNEISKKGGFTFSYGNQISLTKVIVIKHKKQSVQAHLNEIFSSKELVYIAQKNKILLSYQGNKKKDNQIFTIQGRVKDASTGEVLIGATVWVKELSIGTSSNAYGFYSLSIREGLHSVSFSFIGYKSIILVDLKPEENNLLDVELEPLKNVLNEITVISSVDSQPPFDDAVSGTEKLDNTTIKSIPSLLGESDVLRSIQLLPGVARAGEGSTNFYVRGGGLDQNLILLDEAVVYNPSHILGIFSIFNVDAIKDVKLYKGLMPAQYGGRLSSVTDIRLKDGNNKKFAGNGSISLLSSRLTIEGPIVKDKSSFILSARRTYADLLLLKLNPSAPKNTNFYFYDFNGKVNYNINQKNRIFLSGFLGRDVNNLKNNQSSQDLNWSNTTATLRWNHIFKDKLFLNTTALYSQYNYNINAGEIDILKWKSSIKDYTAKADFTFFKNVNNTIKFGLGTTLHHLNPGRGSRQGTVSQNSVEIPASNSLEHFLYFSNEQTLSRKLLLDYGLRYSLFQNVGSGKVFIYDTNHEPIDTLTYPSGRIFHNYHGFEPRLGLRYSLTDNSAFKLSYNRTYQYLHLLSNSSLGFSSMDTWVSSSRNIRPGIADQFALGYYKKYDCKSVYEFSAEVYYKQLQNQIDYIDHAQLLYNSFIEKEIRTGKGLAYGAEFMVKKTTGKMTGWVSYTYSRAKREIPDINNGKSYSANYDQPNNIAIVTNYTISKRWQISMDWVYATGRPVNIPMGNFQYDGTSVSIYGSRNSSRLPAYHRMDISATLFPKNREGKRITGSWTFSLYNAYFRKNALLVFVGPELDKNFRVKEPQKVSAQKVSLLPIIPSISYNITF